MNEAIQSWKRVVDRMLSGERSSVEFTPEEIKAVLEKVYDPPPASSEIEGVSCGDAHGLSSGRKGGSRPPAPSNSSEVRRGKARGGCACTSIDRSHCREPDCGFANSCGFRT